MNLSQLPFVGMFPGMEDGIKVVIDSIVKAWNEQFSVLEEIRDEVKELNHQIRLDSEK